VRILAIESNKDHVHILFQSTPKLDILKIKTGAGRPVTPVERKVHKKYSKSFLTINKGSGFGTSLLDEAQSNLRKKGVVHGYFLHRC